MIRDTTEQELLLQLDRLDARAEFLQAQRQEATRRLAEISRERARLERYLHYLRRSELASY